MVCRKREDRRGDRRVTLVLFHTEMKKTVLYIFLLLILSSCASKKAMVTDKQFARELSRSLKMDLSTKDNLLLYAIVNEWIGVPYRMGGQSKRGTDCSHLTRNIVRRVYGKLLSRSSEEMYQSDVKRIRRGQLKEGDLVFFATGSNRKRVNHVGVYLKKGYFVHASTTRGVMISHLQEPYFLRVWVNGGRVK